MTTLDTPATTGPALARDAIPDLGFLVEDGAALVPSAAPALRFRVRITDPARWSVSSVLLRTQIRLLAHARRYAPGEQARLTELFGPPEGWGRALRSLFWANATSVVPAFRGETTAELVVPVGYDFDVAATKYFAGLDEGAIPLEFLFSGSIFYVTPEGLRVVQVPWEKEARFALPVAAWRDAVEAAFPNSAWLRVHRDTFDRLWRQRIAAGHTTWDEALIALLGGEVRQTTEPTDAGEDGR